jgi:predicted ATP-grasp superfamily ATP-dependent carboligase
MTRVLIAGVSARAAAWSAVRAGFAVATVDAFADRDQPPSVRTLRIGRPFRAAAAARAAAAVPCDAVVYLSGFENTPGAVAALATGRSLWGNPPEVLRRVRDPQTLATALDDAGLARPALTAAVGTDRRWLLKRRASGGGVHVRPWSGGRRPSGSYLQEFVEGTPGSIVFVAARGRAIPLAVTRQLVGDAAFGATGFRYCGSIVAPMADPHFARGPALWDAAAVLADVVARSFALVGVNGIDFIARAGTPLPIEVNPRWCASMELVERAGGTPIFAAHAAACTGGTLPGGAGCAAPRAFGKAVVFARGDVRIAEPVAWPSDGEIADVPHEGERIPAGSPICTVFAEAPTSAACYDALARRAAAVYEAIGAEVHA